MNLEPERKSPYERWNRALQTPFATETIAIFIAAFFMNALLTYVWFLVPQFQSRPTLFAFLSLVTFAHVIYVSTSLFQRLPPYGGAFARWIRELTTLPELRERGIVSEKDPS